eukprot:superscaffoldBa00009498_g24132
MRRKLPREHEPARSDTQRPETAERTRARPKRHTVAGNYRKNTSLPEATRSGRKLPREHEPSRSDTQRPETTERTRACPKRHSVRYREHK